MPTNPTPPPSWTARRTGARTGATRRWLAAALAATGLVGGLSLLGAGSGSAAPTSVTGASFTWGLDDTANAGAYYGGCNFLSAGTAGDNGSSTLWTQTSPSPGYATQSGNVTVEYPGAGGASAQPTWATKCDDPSGNALTTSTYSGGQVVFSGGTGTVDPAAGTASITWDGSFTSVFYGGLVYWSASNPTLAVNPNGTGTLTATVSGYGASMTNSSLWETLSPTTVTLANLSGVTVTSTGFTVNPDYVGVAITMPIGDTAQAAETSANEAYWGSWPQDFVNFQQQTGESSYWYSSGLNDQAKVPSALTVAYTTPSTTTTTTTTSTSNSAPTITTQPADQSVGAGANATFSARASGTPTPSVQWQFEAPGASGWSAIPGATSSTYTVTDATSGDSGTQYEAVFTNSTGTVTTDPATLTVAAATTTTGTYTPVVTIDDTPLTAGGTLTFSATGFAPDETVAVAVHSAAPVALASVTTDGDGDLSSSQALPTSVAAGAHDLVLTGQSSGASASASFTVTAPANCALSAGVQGGSLTWGFKESFRSYVTSGGSANSITATDGATILDQDLAVPGVAASGTYLWPFTSSSSYTSPSNFSVQYGGQLTFSYPAHYFVIVIANPKVTVDGTTGTLDADVTLTVTVPGSAPVTTSQPGVALASISLAGTTTTSSSSGITLTMDTAILDTTAFSYDGSSFYQAGQALDDATVLLSGCAGTSSSGTGSTSTASTGGDLPNPSSNLIPPLVYPPATLADDSSGLAMTGADLEGLLGAGLGAILLGLALVGISRRRGRPARPLS